MSRTLENGMGLPSDRYHKSLQWMLENDITGVIDVSFIDEA